MDSFFFFFVLEDNQGVWGSIYNDLDFIIKLPTQCCCCCCFNSRPRPRPRRLYSIYILKLVYYYFPINFIFSTNLHFLLSFIGSFLPDLLADWKCCRFFKLLDDCRLDGYISFNVIKRIRKLNNVKIIWLCQIVEKPARLRYHTNSY